MVEDDIQHLERIVLSSQHRPPLEGDREEEGERVVEDEVEEAEARGGEVEEGEGGDGREAFVELPQPAKLLHWQPPKEVWIVNPKLQPQVTGPERPRRIIKPPDFLGIEKERDSPSSQERDSLPSLAAQLDSPSPSTERLLSPLASPGSADSPTPPASTRATPLATPDTSPDTSTIGPPGGSPHQHVWLSEDDVLPKQDRRDALEANRHWSIGGGETEQGTHYPMLDWTPRTKRPPPSL